MLLSLLTLSTAMRKVTTVLAFVLVTSPVVVLAVGNNDERIKDTFSPSSSIAIISNTMLRGRGDYENTKRNLGTIFDSPYRRDSPGFRTQYIKREVLIEIETHVPSLTRNHLLWLAATFGPTYNNGNSCAEIVESFLIEPRDLQQRIDEAVALYEKGIITHGRFTLLVGVHVPPGNIRRDEDLFLYPELNDEDINQLIFNVNDDDADDSCSVPLDSQVQADLTEVAHSNREYYNFEFLGNQELVSISSLESESSNSIVRRRQLSGTDGAEGDFVEFVVLITVEVPRTTDTLTEDQKRSLELYLRETYNEINQGDNSVHDPYYREIQEVHFIEEDSLGNDRRLTLVGNGVPPYYFNFAGFGSCNGCPPNDPLGDDTSNYNNGNHNNGNSNTRNLQYATEEETEYAQITARATRPLYSLESVIGSSPRLASKDPPTVSSYFKAVESNIKSILPSFNSDNDEDEGDRHSKLSIANGISLVKTLDPNHELYNKVLSRNIRGGLPFDLECIEFYYCTHPHKVPYKHYIGPEEHGYEPQGLCCSRYARQLGRINHPGSS